MIVAEDSSIIRQQSARELFCLVEFALVVIEQTKILDNLQRLGIVWF